MSVKLETFDTSAVSALTDARLYEFLTNKQVGIVDGVNITSTGGLGLHITSGWGVILGRVFTIKSEDIVVNPSLSGTQKGRLILQIDISNGSEPIKFVTQAAQSLPKLRQEDINKNGTVYQLELATYNVSEVSLSELVVITNKLQSLATKKDVEVEFVKETDKNLDDYKIKGIYYFDGNHIPVNPPAGNIVGWLIVIPDTPTVPAYTVKQIWIGRNFIGKDDHLMYTRSHVSSGNIWSEWTKILTDVDKKDLMPKSGGEFTGHCIAPKHIPVSGYAMRNTWVGTDFNNPVPSEYIWFEV